MNGKPIPIYNDHVVEAFRNGRPLYMIDFNELDQRNVCKRVTHPEMISKKNIADRKIFFVMMMEE